MGCDGNLNAFRINGENCLRLYSRTENNAVRFRKSKLYSRVRQQDPKTKRIRSDNSGKMQNAERNGEKYAGQIAGNGAGF